MSTTDFGPDFDHKAYQEAREVKPERELLERARRGDAEAATHLLMWPKFYHKELIDPEVYQAIIDGALEVAAFVANSSKDPKPGESKDADERYPTIKPLMFFNGADPHAKGQPAPKSIEKREELIGLIVANGDAPTDPDRLTELERRVALTTEFAPMVADWSWDDYLKKRKVDQRPKLVRDAEARLVQFVRWKYSPHPSRQSLAKGTGRTQPLAIDEDLCKSLIGISFPQIEWSRDAAKDYMYPEEWD